MLTVMHIDTGGRICEAAAAEPGCFVIPTRALFGNHTCQAALESDRHLVHGIQMPVVQHPAELQFTCTISHACSMTTAS